MSIRHRIFSFTRIALITFGAIFLLMSVLSITSMPFYLHRWLGTKGAEFDFIPQCIIMPGGSGMPSESNLMRLYYTQKLGSQFPSSHIILLHPSDTAVAASMSDFLVENGLDSSRISWQSKGTSTREQVMELIKDDSLIIHQKIVVVTSPEHMYRTLGVFRKLGFANVGGVAAFEQAMFVDLDYDHRKVGGKWYAPDVSTSLDLRYNFWNYLKLQITCYRELLAIGYYTLNGWM